MAVPSGQLPHQLMRLYALVSFTYRPALLFLFHCPPSFYSGIGLDIRFGQGSSLLRYFLGFAPNSAQVA
jgi:hypothetical protein